MKCLMSRGSDFESNGVFEIENGAREGTLSDFGAKW